MNPARALVSLLAVALAAAAGCGLSPEYHPPTLAPERCATVAGAISHIDGQSTTWFFDGGDRQISVAPGTHQVGIGGSGTAFAHVPAHSMTMWTSTGLTVELALAAGQSYRIGMEPADDPARILIVNATTGRRWSLDPRTLVVYDAANQPVATRPFAP